MCGRVTQVLNNEDLKQYFSVTNDLDAELSVPRYNVGPTTRVCIVADENGEKRTKIMRWGLIPANVRDLSTFTFSTFNARDDKLLQSPMYGPLFKKRRCISVVNGYYEWKKINPKEKQPYYFKPRNAPVMGLAALWDRTTLNDGTTLESCSIITTEPNDVTAEYHDRMPVILMPNQYDAWLDPKTPEKELLAMLKPCPPDFLEIYMVDKAVGSTRNDFPSLLNQVEPDTLF
jgi:putative SOS response-associated peptidase YedK